ncbi:MAG: WXG100 family type VII secretion target [Phycisphaeraceae bacterium]|nr:MAG: WXG100 family type VII secretion target [Phycisphaeraceae bacterium]
MSKAVVDPGELRRFAQDLKRFNVNLMNQLAALQGRLNDLGQTWRDHEHTKFVEEFEGTMKALARFTENADKHIPFLLRKAEKIEEYLNQR